MDGPRESSNPKTVCLFLRKFQVGICYSGLVVAASSKHISLIDEKGVKELDIHYEKVGTQSLR